MGELTGTVVSASAPVVVFTGSSAIAPMSSAKYPPPGWKGNSGNAQPGSGDGSSGNGCTTDHLEEQIVPAAVGKTYLATRWPHSLRSALRRGRRAPLHGPRRAGHVKTNLPAPDDNFTLQPGEVKDLTVVQDFTIESTEPVIVAQMLVAQCYSTATSATRRSQAPSAVDQLRGEYVFLTPSSPRTLRRPRRPRRCQGLPRRRRPPGYLRVRPGGYAGRHDLHGQALSSEGQVCIA
ncbi:MAG: hypothetical protein U0235_27080 [Polyangiaceae bacterium]